MARAGRGAAAELARTRRTRARTSGSRRPATSTRAPCGAGAPPIRAASSSRRRCDAHPGSTRARRRRRDRRLGRLPGRPRRRVTAVEPSGAMVEVMRGHLAAAGVTNVDVVQGAWPDVTVEPHDFTLCSHAMYGCPDLPGFVRASSRCTRPRLLPGDARARRRTGSWREAARRVWGHPHDSPNFQVAYNALLQMGIFPDVLMEDTGPWDPWTSASLEEALAEVRRRFGLAERERARRVPRRPPAPAPDAGRRAATVAARRALGAGPLGRDARAGDPVGRGVATCRCEADRPPPRTRGWSAFRPAPGCGSGATGIRLAIPALDAAPGRRDRLHRAGHGDVLRAPRLHLIAGRVGAAAVVLAQHPGHVERAVEGDRLTDQRVDAAARVRRRLHDAQDRTTAVGRYELVVRLGRERRARWQFPARSRADHDASDLHQLRLVGLAVVGLEAARSPPRG